MAEKIVRFPKWDSLIEQLVKDGVGDREIFEDLPAAELQEIWQEYLERTGQRPPRKRRGGKIDGNAPKPRLDKKPRKR